MQETLNSKTDVNLELASKQQESFVKHHLPIQRYESKTAGYQNEPATSVEPAITGSERLPLHTSTSRIEFQKKKALPIRQKITPKVGCQQARRERARSDAHVEPILSLTF